MTGSGRVLVHLLLALCTYLRGAKSQGKLNWFSRGRVCLKSDISFTSTVERGLRRPVKSLNTQGCSDCIVLTNSVIRAGIHYLIYMYSFTVTQGELVASKISWWGVHKLPYKPDCVINFAAPTVHYLIGMCSESNAAWATWSLWPGFAIRLFQGVGNSATGYVETSYMVVCHCCTRWT